MSKRLLGIVLLGGAVTVGLLLLMLAVIADPEATVEDGVEGHVVELVEVIEDQDVVAKSEPLEPPPPLDEPPPELPPPSFDDDGFRVGTEIGPVPGPTKVALDDADFSDGEYLPIMKVQPNYPQRALARGIEGFVMLEFVVTENGNVRDPVVVEAQPPGIFDGAAIQAALKFKYKPKIVDGEPVAVSGVRNKITFELKDE